MKNKEAIRICYNYLCIGAVWIVISELLFVYIGIYGNLAYLLLSTFWLYWIASKSMNKLTLNVRKNNKSVETELEENRRFLNVQTQILETIVNGVHLEQIFVDIVTIIEEANPHQLCSILLLDEASQCLYTGAAPSLPEEYSKRLDGIHIGPQVGSCGTAAYMKKTIVVGDISTDPLWKDAKHSVEPFELRSCWSTPIISRNGAVVGTFAMYSKKKMKPVSTEIHALETFSRLVGMAIERDRSDERVRVSESKYQLMAENSKDMICMFNLEGILEYVSPSLEKLGREAGDGSPFSWLKEYDYPKMLQAYREIVATKESMTVEIKYQNDEQVWSWLEVQGNPIMNSQGDMEHVLFVSRNITDRKQYEQSLEELAYYDTLTKRPNRRSLTLKLSEALSETPMQENTVALICIDCDRFKNLNESLGYEAGDRFIQMMSDRLIHCVRDQGIVTRVGGDEFIIILSDIKSQEKVLQIVESLMNELRQAWVIDQESFYLTSSIGVVFNSGQSVSDMVQQSEMAMNHAKRSGKNSYYIWNSKSTKNNYNQFDLEKQLYGAMERGEFKVWYQAQINYQTGNIVGVEALLRWHHPLHGVIPPGEFILLAEDTGLIISLGEWVLRHSCQQLLQWDDEGLARLHMSVNISPRQISEPGFVELVFKVLEETGMDPRRLYLEITEGMLLDSDPKINLILHRLHEKGIRISVDDFGTGYSALSYMKRYPINMLKIDRSFIQDIPEDTNDIAIVKAIIEMSKSMNIDVLAEGTETVEQITCLNELGCTVVQGYFFARPLASDDFVDSYSSIQAKAQKFRFN
jgi:diguanylate cyclase (GGDEF)-like protein/PAS domain S-box-containing protein